jgi:signal peptidase II
VPALQAAGGTAIAEQSRTGRRPARLGVLAFAIGAVGLAADVAAKTAALAYLDPMHPPVYLGGLVTLQLVRNPGAAFSMGENLTILLACIALAAFIFVTAYLIPRVRHVGWAVAEGLLLAGISGNLADRLFREPGPFRGYVVDFIQLPNFAIFNVADMCITGAAVLIIWFVMIAQVGPDGRSMKDAARASTSTPAGKP